MAGKDSSAERRYYLLTESEAKLIDATRKEKLQDEYPRHALSLVAWFGGRDLGLHHIDTGNVITELVQVGMDIREQLIRLPVHQELDDGASDSEKKDDSEVDDEIPDEPISWDDVKKNIIPPSVQQVTFTINESPTAELCKDFNERFPGVRIQHSSPKCSSSLEKAANPVVQFTEPQSRQKVAEPPAIPTMTVRQSSEPHSSVSSTPLPSSVSQSSPEVEIAKQPLADSVTVDSIASTAGSLGLTLESRDTITSMYSQWKERRTIPTFRIDKDKCPESNEERLQAYYLALVDLYILATQSNLKDLQYKLLLTFQATNYAQRGSMPHIETVVKAFQYLPVDSPLCRWVLITYAFLWATHDGGTYAELRENNEDMDTEALAKFLHGIAYIRCEFTPGHDIAVLDRWCEVHEHKVGSKEEQMCKENRMKHKAFLEKAKRAERDDEIKEARKLLKAEEERPKRGKKRGTPNKITQTAEPPVKRRRSSEKLDWSRWEND
ncbi:hypothetical protein DM02DRAFT_675151 [Periconia macrospinosa]|uniref:Uncharacterized protein n=1 Tax=Periconia macrospinosa TaxID=97972 RepID=A0A2V1DFE0_9PLEO|nr:hypothetical protein DM02DRAFT_675151 [Periconia macrospinosa]